MAIDVTDTWVNLDITGTINTPEDIAIEAMMPWVAGGWLLGNVLMVVFFLLKAWGLYNINRKLGEQYPWLAWIPVIQVYAFVKAAGKNGIWVLWLILGFIAFVIPGIIIYIILAHGISKRTGRWVWSTLGILFIDWVMLPVIGHKLADGWPKNNTQEPENMPTEEPKKEEEKQEL